MAFSPSTALALIMTGGSEPVRDPGWPKGAAAVANLKSRAAWMEGPPFGGGEWTFFYKGGVRELQEALDALEKIEGQRPEVVVREGPITSEVLKDENGEGFSYDWSFEVWVPQNWERLYKKSSSLVFSDDPRFGQSLPSPRMEVFVDKNSLPWTAIKSRRGFSVRDARASAHGFPAGGSAIRARVTAGGKTLSGAKLLVESTAGGWKDVERVAESPSSDASGLLEVSRLSGGIYRVSVLAEGYASRVLEYARYGANEFKEFEAKLVPASTISGRVLDEAERPLVGVRIRLRGSLIEDGGGYPLRDRPEVTSGERGEFHLTGVPAGKAQLSAHLNGYHHQWDPGDTIAAPSSDVVVRCLAAGSIEVQLVDAGGIARSGLKKGEVNVSIQAADRMGVGSRRGTNHVDEKGRCQFNNVPPGRYRLATQPMEKDKPTPGEVMVTVAGGQTMKVKLRAP